MWKRFVFCAVAAILCGAGTGNAEDCPIIVDQSAIAVSSGATNLGSDFGFELGQSFVPSNSVLASVEIYLADNTTIDFLTPIRVSIWKSNVFDFTTGVLVGSVVQMVPEGPSVDEEPGPAHQSTAVFTFDPPLVMEVGQTYVIQAGEDQTPSHTDLSWRISNGYPFGQAIKDGGPSPFWEDRAFRTFAPECTVPVEVTTWGTVKALYE